MSLGVVQEDLDRFATQTTALLPAKKEAMTYAGTVDSGTKTVHLLSVTKHEKALDPLLRNSRRFRIATAALTSPRQGDTLTRSNTEIWEVDSVEGGEGQAFWFLLVHLVGATS